MRLLLLTASVPLPPTMLLVLLTASITSITFYPVVNSLPDPSSTVPLVVSSLHGPSSPVSAVSQTTELLHLFFNSFACPNRTVSPIDNSPPPPPYPSNTFAPLVSSSLVPPMLLPLFLTASQSPLALLLNVVNNLSGLSNTVRHIKHVVCRNS